MKLIHCADLHLDSKMTSNFTEETAAMRRRELLATFRRMVRFAVQNKVAVILISGDLFDRRDISEEARSCVLNEIRLSPEVQFFYLPGNHEADSLTAGEELPKNLHLFGRRWTRYRMGNLSVTGIDIGDGDASQAAASFTADPGRFNIVMLHGQLAEYAAKGTTGNIALSSFRNKKIDYLALGHVHSYMEGPLEPAGIWCYPGCLEGRGFDETGEHGFVLLEIDTAAKRCKRKFVPSGGRRLFCLTADVTGAETTEDMEAVIRRTLSREDDDLRTEDADDADDANRPNSRDYVRVILTGEASEPPKGKLLYLQENFASEYAWFEIVDETKRALDLGQFAPDSTLKGAFIRLVREDPGLSEEEKNEIIRCGLSALAGEEADAWN